MIKWTQWAILALAMYIVGSGLGDPAIGDPDDRGHRRRHRGAEHSGRDDQEHNRKYQRHAGSSDSLGAVDSPAYREECGVCHFVYHPGLLPSGSWEKILSKLPDHFGETIEMDLETLRVVGEYLTTHSAGHSSARLSARVIRCLDGDTPIRITDVPYIRDEHDEIGPTVFERNSIGSRSNCAACHTTAEAGIFREDTVAIPM